MRNYKVRLYQNKVIEAELTRQLELCRCYSKPLEELNKAKEKGGGNWRSSQRNGYKLKLFL
ncbi:MAG: hypothetical protein M1322_00490 [Candidatus Parvarchaeota archaeon]|jgi:hypothetical protein|nr:hypothetical protein [Candidatus Parvarchaeota archaeon]MCL5106589.1 hypothetical protein [Candidatus Parvarchaeota archaeon]